MSGRISEDRLVSKEGSAIMADFFNKIPLKTLKEFPLEFAQRLGGFMVANGYRMVFNRWYLQADPIQTAESTLVTELRERIEGLTERIDYEGDHLVNLRGENVMYHDLLEKLGALADEMREPVLYQRSVHPQFVDGAYAARVGLLSKINVLLAAHDATPEDPKS